MFCGKKVVSAPDGLTVDPSVIFSLKSGVSERRGKRLGDEGAKPKQIWCKPLHGSNPVLPYCDLKQALRAASCLSYEARAAALRPAG